MIVDAAFLRAVAPETGGKFSRNLHRWLGRMRRRHATVDIRAWRAPSGIILGYDYDGDIVGSRLRNVLGGHAEIGCYVGGARGRELKSFWTRYQKEGVCYTDANHSDYTQRWETKKNRRTCRWCGVEQRLRSRVERRVVESWEAA